MLTHPKCKDCGHSRSKHGLAKVSRYVGWHKRRKIVELLTCFDCDSFIFFGPKYDWEYDIAVDNVKPRHEYQPDNLGYLERKYEKFEKANRHTQVNQETAG